MHTKSSLFPKCAQEADLAVDLGFVGRIERWRDILAAFEFQNPYCWLVCCAYEHKIQMSLDRHLVMVGLNFKLLDYGESLSPKHLGNAGLKPMSALQTKLRTEH